MDNGWQVVVLPWVVGVHGLEIENHLREVLGFLEIPPTAWRYIIETSARTSVEELVFLNQLHKLERHGEYWISSGMADRERMPLVKSMPNEVGRNRSERISGSWYGDGRI